MVCEKYNSRRVLPRRVNKVVRFVGFGNGASTRLFFGLRCVVIGIGAWGLGCYTKHKRKHKRKTQNQRLEILHWRHKTQKEKREAANEVVDGVPVAGDGGGRGGGGFGRSASTSPTTLTPPLPPPPPPSPSTLSNPNTVVRCS